MTVRRLILLAALLAFLPLPGRLAAGAASPDGAPSAQRLLHVLDYLAVDYPEAVKDGVVTDEAEYAEQIEFASRVPQMLAALPSRPEGPALAGEARRLAEFVTQKRPGPQVADLANRLRWAVIRAYDVEIAPRRPPDLREGANLYAAQCAACHGADGRGDGVAGKTLSPPPSNFLDEGRMRQRSVYGLYSTITLGIDGTGMSSYGALGEEQRWALAFHVANLGRRDADVQRGGELWRAGTRRDIFRDLGAIATRSPAEVESQHGADAAAILAFLRTAPEAFARGGNTAIDTSVRLLRESVEAYRSGRHKQAEDLAVSGYLEGFELVEASLDALDRNLRSTVEAEMIKYRGLLRDGAPVAAVEAKAGEIEGLLVRARDLLAQGGLPPQATFLSALVILLREGLEAILVVAAIVALLVRAERRDALPYVHGGWIAALALGALTWVVASYAVRISGATREVTEGVTALISAAVLLYVGFWMHGKSHAQQWQTYLARRLRGALSGRTMWALAFVSFLAVYREVFETVLFYEALGAQAGPGGLMPLLGGMATALVALVVLAWLMFRGGIRLPLGMFFGAGSALLAVLAVVFAGKGIAALQEAGWLPVHSVRFPALPLLGVYPNLQSLMLQASLVVVIAAGFAYTQYAMRRSRG
jgi:high-affinity iron transporter